MKPWKVIGRTLAPDGTKLTLECHAGDYAILANGRPLMSSRMHGSEDALAILGCRVAATLPRPSVLVGGLGMGFTLRATLDVLPTPAVVVVAELLPAVVEWNRGPLGPLADHPLGDSRVRVEVIDVGDIMRSNRGRFDAILLDVDNGPAAITAASNAGLYGSDGVAIARASLKPGGVLAVWSSNDAPAFEARLRRGGFRVRRERVKARASGSGPRHIIVIAQRDDVSAGAKPPRPQQAGRTANLMPARSAGPAAQRSRRAKRGPSRIG